MFRSWFVWAQTVIFSTKPCSKKAGESTNLFFGLRLVSTIFEEVQTSRNPSKPKYCGGFFQQIKVRQPVGRKDSIQTVIRTSRRLELFLYEAAENLIFQTEIKKSKTYSG
jgi:hypothetical protein